MKQKKTGKKILARVGCLLAVCLLLAAVVFFRDWPRYRQNKSIVELQPTGEDITVMSCNVRCLTPLDLGKKSWFYRANLLMEDLETAAPDIIGFQEVTKWQYRYLTECLQGFDSVIEYRDRSPVSEGCPVFYRADRFELVEKGSFWLSETPEKMSKDWGAACYRICSYTILREADSGKEFVVFNTHLDHISDEARIKGIQVVLDKIRQFGGQPAVIMGDFNAEEGSETYESVTEVFLDAAYEAGHGTGDATYQNWGNPDAACRIDYFMLSQTGLTVKDYNVLSVNHDGIYASDHNPIVLEITLE